MQAVKCLLLTSEFNCRRRKLKISKILERISIVNMMLSHVSMVTSREKVEGHTQRSRSYPLQVTHYNSGTAGQL